MIRHILVSAASALVLSVFTSQAATDTPLTSFRNATTVEMPSAAKRLQKRKDGEAVNVIKQSPSFARTKGVKARAPRRVAAAAGNSVSALLYEGFEDTPTNSMQLPDGWTRQSNVPEKGYSAHFYVYPENLYAIPAADGHKYLLLLFTSEYDQDEWVITPEVTIPEKGYQFSYYWFAQPMFFYAIDKDHVNFDADPWEFTNREELGNFRVYISVDGGEWELLEDMMENYKDYTLGELRDLTFSAMQRTDIKLDSYVGKSVKFGFRYTGCDADSFFIDAVSIDYAPLEAFYAPPYSRQFYGLDLGGNYLAYRSLEIYPVNTELTWENMIEPEDDQTVVWEFIDPDTGETTICDDPYYLDVTYHPDYTSDATLMNNIVDVPRIIVSGKKAASGSYHSPAGQMQIGGAAETVVETGVDGIDGIYMRFGVFPFDIFTEGFGAHIEEPVDFGHEGIPIFGYSEDTDGWWHNYCFPLTGREDDYARLYAFSNYVILEEAPMVANGAILYAVGRCDETAELQLSILELDEEGVPWPIPVAVATAKYSDMLIDELFTLNTRHMAINFRFDEPIALSSNDYPNGVLFEVTGFRDGGFEYFAPMQSTESGELEWALAWYRLDIKYGEFDEGGYSFGSVAGISDYTQFNSFAICIDAEYPWLDIIDGSNDIEIRDMDKETVYLGSYYDASKLTVEAPSWLNVKLSGRYDGCKATFSVKDLADKVRTGKVTISGPGVSQRFNVKAINTVSVDEVIAGDDDAPGDIYNALGVKVRSNATVDDLRALPSGIYMLNGKKYITK